MSKNQTPVQGIGSMTAPWLKGTLDSIEFVGADDEEGREPGTYVTVRVNQRAAWRAGGVELRCVPALPDSDGGLK